MFLLRNLQVQTIRHIKHKLRTDFLFGNTTTKPNFAALFYSNSNYLRGKQNAYLAFHVSIINSLLIDGW